MECIVQTTTLTDSNVQHIGLITMEPNTFSSSCYNIHGVSQETGLGRRSHSSILRLSPLSRNRQRQGDRVVSSEDNRNDS